MTTAAIERKTGVPRSTIYFYIRQGLVPEPHKTEGGRALYGKEHVELLQRIGELKREKRSLTEIKHILEPQVIQSRGNGTDLAAREYYRMHRAIIETATEEFMEKGYKRTHVSTIIQKLGINPQLFYKHFPSKIGLLAECFSTFIESSATSIEPQMVAYSDLAERAIRRLATDRRGDELGSMLAAAIRSEGIPDQADDHPIENALGIVMGRFADEIADVRPPGSPPPPVSDELLAYGLLGALNYQSMRVSWGRGLDTADFLRAHLFILLAVLAAVRGEVDVYRQLERYESVIQEAVAHEPESSGADAG